VVVVSAGMIAYRTPDPVPVAADAGEVPVQHYRPFVNFYAMGPASVFAIFREGDDLYGQLTGQRKLRLTVGSDGTASYAATSGEITFALDAERRSSELKLHMNGRDVRIGDLRRAGGFTADDATRGIALPLWPAQTLDRHSTVEGGIPGQIHPAHSPCRDRVDDRVRPNARARRKLGVFVRRRSDREKRSRP